MKRLQVRHHRAADAALAEIGITLVQWDALRHLDQHEGASLHDLAVLTFQTDQSFGALAARLENRGLIERVPSPGRAVRHCLTPKGAELRKSGAEVMDRVLAESFRALSAQELETFGRLLGKLLSPYY